MSASEEKGETAPDSEKELAHKAAKKSMALGGGGRFAKLESSLAKKGVRDPGALAAYIGRRKYGAKKFNSLSAKGRKRA